MSQAEELAKEYEEGLGDDINPGTGGLHFIPFFFLEM